jgi:hypothetical protein
MKMNVKQRKEIISLKAERDDFKEILNDPNELDEYARLHKIPQETAKEWCEEHLLNIDSQLAGLEDN